MAIACLGRDRAAQRERGSTRRSARKRGESSDSYGEMSAAYEGGWTEHAYELGCTLISMNRDCYEVVCCV